MSWAAPEAANPELPAFRPERLDGKAAYLATMIRKDGSPRVQPVTPIIGEGHF
jgi:hypothetical protein